MAISIVGSATQNQSTSSQTITPGSGFTTGDVHLIRVEVKSGASFPTNPANYSDVPNTTQSVSGNVLSKLIYRVLTTGDASPSINGSGVAVMTQGITLRGVRTGAIADIIETVSLGLNSSSTAIAYGTVTIATAGCMVVLFGTHGSSSSATFGTPTTLSGGAVNSATAYAGNNLKSTIWTDLQTSAVSITAGNIPLTGASLQTNRSTLVVIRPTVSASVTVSDAGDELFYDGESGTITGTSFKPSSTDCTVKVCSADNILHGSAVSQTVTSSTNTSAVVTWNLSSFTAFTNLYVFVTNSAGQSNASGYVIQRELRATISTTLNDRGDGDDAAVAWTSKTGIYYRVTAVSVNGTLLASGSTGTTNGSGVFALAPITLTSGGPIANGDPVWLTVAKDDGTAANVRCSTVKFTPTYG